MAHRDHVGKERMSGALLLLRLLAARCLLLMRRLDEAQVCVRVPAARVRGQQCS